MMRDAILKSRLYIPEEKLMCTILIATHTPPYTIFGLLLLAKKIYKKAKKFGVGKSRGTCCITHFSLRFFFVFLPTHKGRHYSN